MRNEAVQSSTPLAFGLFDWIDDSGRDTADVYELRLKMLEYADKAGFWGYHLAEHHGTPLSLSPSPSVFLAAAAQRTRNIRLGSLVHLLPLYDPLRLMQEVCMLDHLSRGRFELGLGRGVVPWELELFGLDGDTARARFNEVLEVLLMGLKTGRVDFEGRFFNFKDVRIHLRPRQQPYPGLWYPTTNVESMPNLGREGYSTVLHYLSLAQMHEAFALYRQSHEAHRLETGRRNGHVRDPKLGFICHVYVAESDEQAHREAKIGFDDFFRNFSYLGRTRGTANEGYQRYLDWQGDFEGRLADGWYIVGSPATVRQQLRQQADATGCNYFVGSFAFGSLSDAQVMRSIHLFASEVMPALNRPD